MRHGAKQGSIHALTSTDVCYSQGIGVAKDVNQAREISEMAAQTGHPLAQYNYACALRDENDEASAFSWFKLAANQGHKASIMEIADRYEKGVGVEKDLEEATRLKAVAKSLENRVAVPNDDDQEDADDGKDKKMDTETKNGEEDDDEDANSVYCKVCLHNLKFKGSYVLNTESNGCI